MRPHASAASVAEPAVRNASSNGDAPIKLRASDLSFFYGNFQALKDVTIEFRANRVTALIGPSGCGKSTLIQVFNRMYDLIPGARARGSVRLDGDEEITTTTKLYELRRRVGMVFQRANPFPMSIYDNVAFGPRLLGWSRPRIEQAVEQSLRITGLWDEVSDRLDWLATGMSGGQQQRLCIARCLAVNPEVILMDEPCSALDPISTMRIEELIRTLRQDYTIVIVTHNLQQAKRVSDYTAFMLIEPFLRHGELVEFDKTETIFQDPHDSRTRDYVNGKFG